MHFPKEAKVAIVKFIGKMQKKSGIMKSGLDATQRAKIAEKVHKPPLGVNVINFELNGFTVVIG